MESAEPKRSIPSWAWAAAFLFLWGALLVGQAPSISTDDSGETVSAAVVLGVPHPPGHPLLNLLGRLAVAVPLGSAAFRMNLLSAAALALSALFLAAWTHRTFLLQASQRGMSEEPEGERIGPTGTEARLAAAGVFLTLGFSIPSLQEAQSAKGAVYNLSLLLLVALCALCRFDRESSARRLALVLFLFGLGLSLHWPVAVVGGVFLLYWILKQVHLDWNGWIRAGVWGLVGASPILYLPLRAHLNPVLNWGHPDQISSFLWVLSRAPYTEIEAAPRAVDLYLRQTGWTVRHLLTTVPWAFLALLGWYRWRRWNPIASRGWTLAVLAPVVAISVLPRLQTETFFLIPVYLTAFLGIWSFLIVSGWNCMMLKIPWIGRRSTAVVSTTLLVMASWGLWKVSEGSQTRRLMPHDLGSNILMSLPRGSLLLGEGDVYMMSLMNACYVEGRRSDVQLVPTVFLNENWGFEEAVAALRPPVTPPFRLDHFDIRVNWFLSLSIPTAANPARPVFVSTGKGALDKAPPAAQWRFWPAGLVYEVRTEEPEPSFIRQRIWALGDRQRRRGRFLYREESPNDPTARELYGYYTNHYLLGANLLQGVGRLQEAADDYAQALRFYPDSGEAFSNLAAVIGATGFYEMAEVFCRKAHRVQPKYAGSWDNLGNIFALQGRWDDAIEAYGHAVELDPNAPAARANLDHALKMKGKPVPALAKGRDVDWYISLGRRMAQEQRWLLAEAAFETAEFLGGDSPELCNNLGVSRAQIGRWSDAAVSFEKGLQRFPNFCETYKNFGLLLIQEGKTWRAREVLDKGFALCPESADIQSLLFQLRGP